MNLNQNINDVELIFLDVETTGLSPAEEFVCEIGAVKVRGEKTVDQYQVLIRPPKPMPYNAFRVHGISDEALANAPRFASCAEEFLAFVGNSLICAYNAPFDAGFINHELCRIHKPQLVGFKIDVLPMARATVAAPKYNLKAMVEYFAIETCGFHRALADAVATRKVFFRLTELIAKPCKVGDIAPFFV